MKLMPVAPPRWFRHRCIMASSTLITGGGGMIGRHLAAAVTSEALVVTSLHAAPGLVALDIRDAGAVLELLRLHRPEVIHHLAGQSDTQRSWADPAATLQTNLMGTSHLLSAVAALRAEDAGYDPLVLLAGSATAYGASLTAERLPITEDAPLQPLSPYGVSKAAADMLGFQAFASQGMRVLRLRIFNTAGPGRQGDAMTDFCAQVAALRRQGATEGRLRCGNLATRRAILDVRDLVAAMLALVERGRPGAAYNISASTATEIGALVPILEALSGIRLHPAPAPELFRPADEAVVIGDTRALRADTGWTPLVPLEATVRHVLDHAMQHG